MLYICFTVHFSSMKIISQIVPFLLSTVQKNHIDDSHAIGHAFQVLRHSHLNWKQSSLIYPDLLRQRDVIYTSALVHDMCDNKYVDEKNGLTAIQNYLYQYTHLTIPEINAVSSIISTMSYSKVKKTGFPDLGEYQMAYHIVRESDLLAAYDVDRSIIYNLYKIDPKIETCIDNANHLFKTRVWKHLDDSLFTTAYSLEVAQKLVDGSYQQMDTWREIYPSAISTITSGYDLSK